LDADSTRNAEDPEKAKDSGPEFVQRPAAAPLYYVTRDGLVKTCPGRGRAGWGWGGEGRGQGGRKGTDINRRGRANLGVLARSPRGGEGGGGERRERNFSVSLSLALASRGVPIMLFFFPFSFSFPGEEKDRRRDLDGRSVAGRSFRATTTMTATRTTTAVAATAAAAVAVYRPAGRSATLNALSSRIVSYRASVGETGMHGSACDRRSAITVPTGRRCDGPVAPAGPSASLTSVPDDAERAAVGEHAYATAADATRSR